MDYKKGSKFRYLADDIEILEREDNWVLAKVAGSWQIYYDIATIVTDRVGDEQYQPSMNANGLHEDIPGGQKIPLSLEVMTGKFNGVVAETRRAAASKKQSAEDIENRITTIVARVSVVKQYKDEAQKALASLVNGYKPIDSILKDKKAKAYADQISFADQILNLIK